jgi:hypothetical protein
MNPSNPTATATNTKETKSSFADAIFDVGVGWAALSLKMGKAALEQSAKTLEHTAKALDALAKGFEKDAPSDPSRKP